MSWVATAIVGSAVVGGGVSAYGQSQQNKANKKNSGWQTAPEYPEAEGARAKWWETLQGMTPENDFGAIQPDWADIWENAQNRVRQYYWGSPTTMGLAGKVKASSARRGVSDSDATEANLAAMGVEEGNQLKDMATQMGIQRTSLTENARQSWLNSLSNLSGQRPNTSYTPYNYTSPWIGVGSLISGVGSASAGYMAQDQANKQQSKQFQTWLDRVYPTSNN